MEKYTLLVVDVHANSDEVKTIKLETVKTTGDPVEKYFVENDKALMTAEVFVVDRSDLKYLRKRAAELLKKPRKKRQE